MVDFENAAGFKIMSIIIKNIESEKNKLEKFCFKLKIKKFCFLGEFVFVIIKYMLKCLYKLGEYYGCSKEIFLRFF